MVAVSLREPHNARQSQVTAGRRSVPSQAQNRSISWAALARSRWQGIASARPRCTGPTGPDPLHDPSGTIPRFCACEGTERREVPEQLSIDNRMPGRAPASRTSAEHPLLGYLSPVGPGNGPYRLGGAAPLSPPPSAPLGARRGLAGPSDPLPYPPRPPPTPFTRAPRSGATEEIDHGEKVVQQQRPIVTTGTQPAVKRTSSAPTLRYGPTGDSRQPIVP